MDKRVHVVVSGKVQGIFFRSNIKNLADNLGIKGYVKNVENDKLEAVFEGTNEAIEKMLEFCKEGPEEAEISAIVTEEEQLKNEFINFSVV